MAESSTVPSTTTPPKPAARAPAIARIFGIRLGVFKTILFLLALLPLARWIWLGVNNGLTANPVEFLTRSSGTWTLVSLLITLSITPLRVMAKQPVLLRVRRMCGLFAFFYACLHFTTYIWWDQWFDVFSIAKDVAKRPFITVGFAAFVGLIVLASTSTQRAMRRLGRRWQKLHRIVYAIVALALLHYWWQKAGKNDFATVWIYILVFLGLMGWRMAWWRRPS